MVAISIYSPEIREKILSGEVRQIIKPLKYKRKTRKSLQRNTPLQIYYQLNTLEPKKLGDSKCINFMPVEIFRNGFIIPIAAVVGQDPESERLKQHLAQSTGFESWATLINYIETRKNYSLPFKAVIIEWSYPLTV